MSRKVVVMSLLLLSPLLSGCADLSYYMHSVKGHLDIMAETRDIEDILEDTETTEPLREKLELVGEIRQFAFEQLALPESDSYTEFADLKRDYVVQSLFASEEFSIKPYTWCYPIVGCAGYRGYYDEARLDTYMAELKAQHYDVYVAKVPAYSTLGWFDDPVLNTFIYWPDYRLAGLIFHELSHQRLYIDGDTTFNESFAVAVQVAGVERWLTARGELDRLARYRRHIAGRAEVMRFIESKRAGLAELYREPLSDELKREAKARFLQTMQDDYQQLTAKLEGSDGFSKWFAAGVNNAKLVSVSTYHARAGAFRQILDNMDGDFAAFFDYVERISELEQAQRNACLDRWQTFADAPITDNKPADFSECRAG